MVDGQSTWGSMKEAMAITTQSRVFGAADLEALEPCVRAAVDNTPVLDIHTHLYDPKFESLLLWGIDELLTYHYLIAELFRVADLRYDTFWGLTKPEQAQIIWEELFIKRSPVSEACRGVLTVLNAFGLDVSKRDLNGYRKFFEHQDLNAHIDRVFEAANLESVVMTNDPFDDTERTVWEQLEDRDSRFQAALRIDPLLNDWEDTAAKLRERGYEIDPSLNASTQLEVRRFLNEWAEKMDARYMAVSLPPEFAYPDASPRSELIRSCIVPVAQERNMPFALMIGVTRGVNPQLRVAGDGVGKGDLTALANLCAEFPGTKFMTTVLSRENQHELCVLGRKFPNLLIFGCWWFLNNPTLITEMTSMRLELLGLGFIPQHSDARVLEQVVYKWKHSRAILADVLVRKYTDLVATGWQVTGDEIQRDVEYLLGGAFIDFCN